MDLRLAAPWNLVCLVAVLPLGAIFLLVRRRTNRALVALALPEQRWPAAALPVALACASFLFVAVAATEPELRVQRTSPMRTDAQTYVVVDTSTSMLARRS